MKFKEFKHTPVQPDTYEASMALNQLMRIGKHAIKLHNMIDDAAEMEAWVAKKIDLAGDYVKKVHGYMQGEKAGLYDDGGMTESREEIGDYAKEKKTGKIVRIVDFEDDIYTISYGEDKGENDVTAKDLKFLDQTGGDQEEIGKFGEDAGEKIANMAQNMTRDEFISNADELGLTPEEAAEYYKKMQGGAYASKFEDAGDMDLIGDGAENLGLDSNKFDYYYDTSGAGYGEVRTKSGKAILQFEYDRDGDAEVSTMDNKTIANIKQGEQLPNNVTSKLNMIKEDAGEQALANDIGLFFVKKAKEMLQSMERPNKNDQEYEEYVDIAQAFKKGIQAGLDEVNMSDFEFSNNPFGDFGRGIDDGPDEELVKILAKHGYQPGPDGANDKATIVRQRDESVSEDAGEGHMSKSTLYHTAKYAIELMDMINKGDDLEGWVQSKLNKAADYLQGVYNYEEYQKLNPYREELDSNVLQKHAQVVQKNIDEILAKETELDDIDTKPGMMRILAKRVNEVEKEIAKETRKKTDESGILYRAGVKKYGKAGMKAIQSAAGKGASHQEIGKIKDKHLKDDEDLEEGLKDWARNTAMAGIIVAGLAGVGSIQDAIDRSVPAVQAMETALEMAQDQGNTELADMIEKDLSAVKVRLSSGKDLGFVKGMQEKYSKFVKTEGLEYESRLAMMLNQQLK